MRVWCQEWSGMFVLSCQDWALTCRASQDAFDVPGEGFLLLDWMGG
jgi:hypothetical protein